MHHHGYTLKTMTTTRLRSADQRAPKRRSPVKTRLPHSRMTGLPAPTLWSAKPAPLTATFHIPTRPRPSSPMNRGRLHTGKEGSGTLGGKAGRSRDATPHTWYWYCFSLFCHHLAAVTFSGLFVDVSPLPSYRLVSISRYSISRQHHRSTASSRQSNQGLHVVSQQHSQPHRWQVACACRLATPWTRPGVLKRRRCC